MLVIKIVEGIASLVKVGYDLKTPAPLNVVVPALAALMVVADATPTPSVWVNADGFLGSQLFESNAHSLKVGEKAVLLSIEPMSALTVRTL